ncbi:MAG: gamma-glutamyltransferase family protein [Propionibacteriaceae bacterium]|jgi:gamma-glutamyltranspeptidase/glutathione hydrolase|nr:gamma-glutamyltransferase family protein [Propionibacteriaceae bacterium]
MVASTHWLVSASAQAVLERGGNAFDAAVAGAFVLHVVEPHLNGPGGDMVGIFATATDPGTPVVLCGQGPAPAGATIEHYLAEGLDLVPGAGALAAAIPGAVDAWLLLLRDHGTWSLPDILAFAIDYATHGHPVLAAVCRTIGGVADLFRESWTTSLAHWMPAGRVPLPGEVIYNHTYAELLSRLATSSQASGLTREQGIDAARTLWRAEVGTKVEQFFRAPHRHSEGGDHAGVLQATDIAAWQATYEPAVIGTFRGYTIAKQGPWGQGPVLIQMLKLLEGYDDAQLDPSTEIGAHLILEAEKLALADRDTWYGDAMPPEALAYLLSAEYAAQRRELIGETASHEFRPGEIPGFPMPPYPVLRESYDAPSVRKPVAAGIGEPSVRVDALEVDSSGRTRGDTCHIDVVDAQGNMISATPSGGWLQSSPTVPGLGFCMGSRLQMNWLDPASPSALTPGKRPRTTLTPTLVLKDGHPVMALGSPGGDQQDQWQLPLLLRVLVGGLSPQQAIDAPNLHSDSAPGSFWPRTWTPGGSSVENRIGDAVIAGLERRGHVITRSGDWALGRLSCVTSDPETGLLGAAANPRGAQGYAVGR